MKTKSGNNNTIATISATQVNVKNNLRDVTANAGSKSVNNTATLVSNDREKIQSQLDKQLQQRPSASDLKSRNILKDTTASPALHSAQMELQRLQLESNLDQKLSNRPSAANLVKQNILKAEDGAIAAKQTTSAASGKTKIDTKLQSKTTVKSVVNNKQLISRDPKNMQLVSHDPHDYQLVLHDPKDYQLVVHDTSHMQLVVSPKTKSSHMHATSHNAFHANERNVEDSSFSDKVMINPLTGSPMSHAQIRKQKKLLKLRDSFLQQQQEQIPPTVSNAKMMHDPLKSHKSNALVAVSKTNTAAKAASVTSTASVTKSKGNPKDAIIGHQSRSEVKQSTGSRSTSPAADIHTSSKMDSRSRSTSLVAASTSHVTASGSDTKKKPSPQPQQQQQQQQQMTQKQQSTPLKTAASPVISAKPSASSIRVRA